MAGFKVRQNTAVFPGLLLAGLTMKQRHISNVFGGLATIVSPVRRPFSWAHLTICLSYTAERYCLGCLLWLWLVALTNFGLEH
jgi:hypothetical protein